MLVVSTVTHRSCNNNDTDDGVIMTKNDNTCNDDTNKNNSHSRVVAILTVRDDSSNVNHRPNRNSNDYIG